MFDDASHLTPPSTRGWDHPRCDSSHAAWGDGAVGSRDTPRVITALGISGVNHPSWWESKAQHLTNAGTVFMSVFRRSILAISLLDHARKLVLNDSIPEGGPVAPLVPFGSVPCHASPPRDVSHWPVSDQDSQV